MNFPVNRISINFLCIMMVALLSFCLIGYPSISVSSSSQSQNAGINIDLISDSLARFFKCGETPVNGTSLESSSDAQTALTDRDLNTIIMGDARFDVSLAQNASIINIPGPDLMVIELAGAEPINASVTSPETGETKSLMVSPIATSDKNSCDYTMNQALVDLSSFGVAEGAAVPSIHLDNFGYPDTSAGSDIGEIFILGAATGSSVPSPPFFGGWKCPTASTNFA